MVLSEKLFLEEAMYKFVLAAILAAFILSPMPSMAAFEGPGAPDNQSGFSGPISGALADTVAAAKNLSDDSPVVLTGNIVSRVAGDDDEFIFRDKTGEIRVEIDKKAFAGQKVTPQDTVRISGEVEKDFGKEVEIDVKRLEILK